jgi:hypothetical protein
LYSTGGALNRFKTETGGDKFPTLAKHFGLDLTETVTKGRRLLSIETLMVEAQLNSNNEFYDLLLTYKEAVKNISEDNKVGTYFV